jgi:hypothetical protein
MFTTFHLHPTPFFITASPLNEYMPKKKKKSHACSDAKTPETH